MVNSLEKEFQFELVNFSDSNQSVNLLESDVITSVNEEPIPIVPTPTPYVSPLLLGANIYFNNVYNPTLNVFYAVSPATSNNTIYVIDGTTYSVTGTFSTTIQRVRGIAYCSQNNYLYVSQADASALVTSVIKIYDCNTLSLVTSVSVPTSGTGNRNTFYQITYDSTLNKVICPFGLPTTNATELANSGFVMIDCSNNSTTTYLTGKGWNQNAVYDPINNAIHLTFNNNAGVNPCGYYSYSLDTLSIVNITTFASNVTNYIQSIVYNSNDNSICIVNEGVGVYEVNPSTYSLNSIITGLTSPRRAFLDSVNNLLYVTSQSALITIVNLTTNVITSTITTSGGGGGTGIGGSWLSFNNSNSLFFGNNAGFYTYVIPSIYSNNYYIQGTSTGSYNNFIQSINDNPIIIYKIIMSLPQEDMPNPLQVQYKDANGESNTDFYQPNNYLDAFQKQNNIVVLEFEDGLIFDINYKIVNYLIPANTTVRFVVFYKQLLKSDNLDVVIYEENKAKYKISKSLDNKITANKYWGDKKLPDFLNLKPDWLSDLKTRFKKVELIAYDTPELSSGSIETKKVYKDLFGFKKEVKAKNISITESKKIKKNTKIKLSSKKQFIKPIVSEYQQVEEVFQDMLRVNAHEIPLEKIIPMEMPIEKIPMKPRPVEITADEVFEDILRINAHEIKLDRVKVPKIKGAKPIQVQLDDLSPEDVFNRSFEDYGSGYLIGVRKPCEEQENKDKFDYGIYYIKPNNNRYTAFRHSGDFPVKIELTKDWYNDMRKKFNEVNIIVLVRKNKSI